jgi:uncharacterized phage protein (TIGR02218 family)
MPLRAPTSWKNALAISPSFLVQGVRIQRTDGEVFCVTNNVRDLELSDDIFETDLGDRYAQEDESFLSRIYRSEFGLAPSQIQETTGLKPDNYDLRLFLDVDFINTFDVRTRKFSQAEVATFTYDYRDLARGIFELRLGYIGAASIKGTNVNFTVKALATKAAQHIADVTAEICRHQFGDPGCKVDVENGENPNGFPYSTPVALITEVHGPADFTIEAVDDFPSDFFERGWIRFNAGINAGLHYDVKTFDAGRFTLYSAPLGGIAEGDPLYLRAGCKKTHRACWEDHNNAINSALEHRHPTTVTANNVRR